MANTEAWTSGDGSVLPEGTAAWVLVDGVVLEAPLLWAGGRWYAHDVEGHAFDRPNPVKAYMVLTPPAPPAVRGPHAHGDPVPPCACGTVEAWHNPGCVLYPEGGYPADQPWRGPPKPAPEPDRYDSAGNKLSPAEAFTPLCATCGQPESGAIVRIELDLDRALEVARLIIVHAQDRRSRGETC